MEPLLDNSMNNIPCDNSINVIPSLTFINVTNFCMENTSNIHEVPEECISLISNNSYESFDSWNDDDNLLKNEILRSRVFFKRNYTCDSNV